VPKVSNSLIEEVATRYNLLPSWLKAVLWVESRVGQDERSRVEDHINDLSVGPGQILTATALDIVRRGLLDNERVREKILAASARVCHYGCRELIKTLKEHEVGVELAGAYLGWQMRRYGDIEMAVSSYNAGSVRYKEDGSFVNQGYVDKWERALRER